MNFSFRYFLFFLLSFFFLSYILFDHFYYLEKRIKKNDDPQNEISCGIYSSAFNSLNDESRNSLAIKKEIIDLTFRKFIKVPSEIFLKKESLNEDEFIAKAFISNFSNGEITILINDESQFHSLKKISVDDFIFSFFLKKNLNEENKFFCETVLEIKKINSQKIILKINLEKVSFFCFLNFLSKLRIYNSSEFNSTFDFFTSGMKVLDASGFFKIIAAKENKFLKLKKVFPLKKTLEIVSQDSLKEGTVTLKYFRNQSLEINQLLHAKIDFIIFNSPEEWFNLNSLINRNKEKFIKIKKRRKGGYSKFIKFNMKNEIFKNKNFRKAIALVFDYDSCSKMFYGNEMNYSPFFFDEFDFENKDYSKNEKKFNRRVFYNEIYHFSLPFKERVFLANKILDANQFPWKKTERFKNGKRIELKIITADPKIRRVINLYRNSLKKIGITLLILQLDSTMFQNKLRNLDFDIVIKNYSYQSQFINSFEILRFFGLKKSDLNGDEEKLLNEINKVNSQKDFFELIRKINFKFSNEFRHVMIFKDHEKRIVFNKENFLHKKLLMKEFFTFFLNQLEE